MPGTGVRLNIIMSMSFFRKDGICFRNGLMRFIKGILNSWPGLTSVLRMIPHISKSPSGLQGIRIKAPTIGEKKGWETGVCF